MEAVRSLRARRGIIGIRGAPSVRGLCFSMFDLHIGYTRGAHALVAVFEREEGPLDLCVLRVRFTLERPSTYLLAGNSHQLFG